MIFRFKQFNIDQKEAPFKVGTDGIILGAWCNTSNCNSSLDIGTGTSIIALILAQRTKKPVTALEINETAFTQALKNIANSPWNEQVQLFNQSFQDYCNNSATKFDLIVSNPPYFINSLKSDNPNKSAARHNDTLTHKDILFHSKKVINDNGKLCVVLPIVEGLQFIESAKAMDWHLTKLTSVYPNPKKPVKRYLIELQLKPNELIEDSIIIETGLKRHDYTEEYKSLTRDFYIIFD